MEGYVEMKSSVILHFLYLFGLSSISSHQKSRAISFSYFKIGYALLLALLVSLCCYYQSVTYLNHRVEAGLLHGVIYFYPTAANSIITVILILSTVYGSKIFAEFINIEGNNFIRKALPDLFSANIGRLTLAISIFILPYFLDFFFYPKVVDVTDPWYQAMGYIFTVYNFACIGQFSLGLGTIRRLYESINKKVEELTNQYKEIKESEFVWKSAAGNGLTRSVMLTNPLPKTPEEVDEMYQLRRQHHQVFKMCRVLDYMYAMSNGVLVAHHAVIGVIHSYWALRIVLAKDRVHEVSEIVFAFRSAILSFLSIIWLVLPTTAVEAQVDRTRQLIRNGLIAVTDKNQRSQMQTFILQLTLENISFSPFGFFELTNELLLSLLGAVVSYLVILLQYQIMLDEQASTS